MKLTVLVDNNTIIDRYFYGEPGVSYFIEDEDIKVLFDVGYSKLYIKNAIKMGLDIKNIDSVVISHGHNDHTGGLFDLIKFYTECKIEKINYNKPKLIAHPLAFLDKETKEGEEIGSLIKEDKLRQHFDTNLSKNPIWLTDKLVFLGEIERTNDFENKTPIGVVKHKGETIDDYVLDDSALAYKTEKGLIIITGCSHVGICNIIEYAKKVCKEDRILDVIGGFHLLDPDEKVIESTCKYIKQNSIKDIHPCHCTDLKSKIALSKASNLKEVGVGLVLQYK